MRFRYGSIIFTLAVAVAGCNEPGELYQRPQGEVHDLLRTVEVPLYMFGTTADTEAIIDGSDPAKVVWKIKADDSNLMKFTATLIPEGAAQTRVILDLEGSKEGNLGNIDARLNKLKEVRALYLASITEAMDSTLDGRAYDITATYPALMSATAANAGHLFPPNSRKASPSDEASHR